MQSWLVDTVERKRRWSIQGRHVMGPRISGSCLPLLASLGLLCLCAGSASAFSFAFEGETAPVHFCQQLVSKLDHCPRPPTVNNINWHKFSGMWYQIGVNARTAFGGLMGSQCVATNYSQPVWNWGQEYFDVITQKKQVVGASSRTEVTVISNSAAAVGLGIRQICGAIAGRASVSSYTKQVQISTLGTNADVDASVGGIQNSVGAVSLLSQQIFTALGRIQLLNNYINGVNVPREINITLFQVEIKRITKAVNLLCQQLEIQRGTIYAAADKIQQSTKSPLVANVGKQIAALASLSGPLFLAGKGMVAANAAIQQTADFLGARSSISDFLSKPLGQDPRQIAREASKFLRGQKLLPPDTSNTYTTNTAAAQQTHTATNDAAATGGTTTTDQTNDDPLANALAGLINSGRQIFADAAQALGMEVKPKVTETAGPDPQVYQYADFDYTAGRAVRNPYQAGKMMVTYPSGQTRRHWVVRLTGAASTGYDTALVFSCVEDVSNGMEPLNGLVLLSRTPTVTKAVFDEALEAAAAMGIMLGGDNPFVRTSQNSRICTSGL